MQAVTADTVIAYITHDDQPNISSASSGQRMKQRDGLLSSELEVHNISSATRGGPSDGTRHLAPKSWCNLDLWLLQYMNRQTFMQTDGHIYIQTRSLQYFAPLPGGEINVQFEVELIVCSLIPVLLS